MFLDGVIRNYKYQYQYWSIKATRVAAKAKLFSMTVFSYNKIVAYTPLKQKTILTKILVSKYQ